MANIGAFIEKEASYRRQFNAKNENLSELDRMNNLNTRFMNFLDLVKCETKRSEYLQASLFDKKQEIVVNLRENHSKYQEDLLLTKKYLNDLTYSLNSVQVNERSNRIKIEWFSKLLKFELDNLNLRPKLNIVCAPPPDASINYQISQIFNVNSSSSSSGVDYESSQQFFSLSTTSDLSSSQTSLSSMSCTSSVSSSGASYCEETVPVPAAASTQLSDAQIQLEAHLSNAKLVRTQLESDYDKKISAIFDLKDNVNKLNSNLNELNNNLDDARTTNVNLNESVRSLRKEIEFYRKLNTTSRERPVGFVRPLPPPPPPPTQSYAKMDEFWFQSELDRVKKEAHQEFEQFNKQQLNAYEDYLEKNLLSQLEMHEAEFNKEADKFEAESDQILDELSELNQQLIESVVEYESLGRTNQVLTERLIQLSNSMCSFSQLSPADQDCLILNFSVKNLDREVSAARSDIKARKKELSLVKSSLIQKDIIDLLEPSERHLINPQTNPWLNVATLNPSSLMLKQHYSEQKSQHEQTQTNNIQQQIMQNKPQEQRYELNIRPYNSQIEYTKSNLFAYLKLNFDLTRNYYALANKQNSKQINNSLNCLRIVVDSIDGHSIVLENSHKILDFDLSEWTLRREIQNCPNFDLFNNNASHVEAPVVPLLKISADLNEQPIDADSQDSKLITVIDFKFPKGIYSVFSFY